MSKTDVPAILLNPTYRPSGLVGGGFWPLAAGALGVAGLMAYVLCMAEMEGMYGCIIFPAMLGAPALAAAAAAIRWGKCRNTRVGMLFGVAGMLVYYMGYWQISYHVTAPRQDKQAIAQIQKSGLPGTLGYFAYRCQNTQYPPYRFGGRMGSRTPKGADLAVLFGLECLILVVAGLTVGYRLSCRLFIEQAGRWARRIRIRMRPQDESGVVDALADQDWQRLAGFQRLLDGVDEPSACSELTIECVPDQWRSGIYVTLGRPITSLLVRLAGRLLGLDLANHVHRRLLSAESAESFIRAFPGIFGGSADSAGAGDRPITPRLGPQEQMREIAIAATRESLARAPGFPLEDLRISPASVRAMGRVRASVYQGVVPYAGVPLLIGLICLFASAYTPRNQYGPIGPAHGRLIGAFLVCLVMAGATALLWPHIARHRRQEWAAARPGSLLPLMACLPIEQFKLSFPEMYDLGETGTDDHVWVAADPDGRLLLVEGIRYRYVVPVSAILDLSPLQSGRVVAIQLELSVGDEVLKLVLWRVNYKADWGRRGHQEHAREVCNTLRVGLGIPAIPPEGTPRGFEVVR